MSRHPQARWKWHPSRRLCSLSADHRALVGQEDTRCRHRAWRRWHPQLCKQSNRTNRLRDRTGRVLDRLYAGLGGCDKVVQTSQLQPSRKGHDAPQDNHLCRGSRALTHSPRDSNIGGNKMPKMVGGRPPVGQKERELLAARAQHTCAQSFSHTYDVKLLRQRMRALVPLPYEGYWIHENELACAG